MRRVELQSLIFGQAEGLGNTSSLFATERPRIEMEESGGELPPSMDPQGLILSSVEKHARGKQTAGKAIRYAPAIPRINFTTPEGRQRFSRYWHALNRPAYC